MFYFADRIVNCIMQTRTYSPRALYSLSRRFVPIGQLNIPPTRIFRRPLFLHFSFVTASVLTAAIFYPLFLAQSQMQMESYRTSQAGLVRYLKRTLRFTSPRVEHTLMSVDRKHFVDSTLPIYMIYQDMPLPIGYDETISAPHMHATCLELLEDRAVGKVRILDVGSGSGYLTACLGVLAGEEASVLGIEKHYRLAEKSRSNIWNSNPELLAGPQPKVKILTGNVLAEVLNNMEAFDVIHVGAAASSIPMNLVDKLNPGGRMVIPVGPRSSFQELMCVDKDMDGIVSMESLMQVRYVPLTEPTDGKGNVPVN